MARSQTRQVRPSVISMQVLGVGALDGAQCARLTSEERGRQTVQ
ncbi:hypothetical protein [Pseudothauera rhizosphaerae]|nr:hypothetical protein [Pseudothauera rhizosphaerae]